MIDHIHFPEGISIRKIFKVVTKKGEGLITEELLKEK